MVFDVAVTTYSISQEIFVVLCIVVVMQSFIMNSHEVFIHIYQGCFAGTGAIVRLPQCQWSKPDGYGKISQCITTTKHSKAKTVCIFLGIYCIHTQNSPGELYTSVLLQLHPHGRSYIFLSRTVINCYIQRALDVHVVVCSRFTFVIHVVSRKNVPKVPCYLSMYLKPHCNKIRSMYICTWYTWLYMITCGPPGLLRELRVK